MTTTKEAIAEMTLTEGTDYIVTSTQIALNPYQVEFLRDFNYYNFPEVTLTDNGQSGWLSGERTALYDFAKMLDDERIAYSEIGLVRRLVDHIKLVTSNDIEGIDPERFE